MASPVVVVTGGSGSRAFKATSWVIGEDHSLAVMNFDELVASYPPGAWQSVHQAAAQAADRDRPRV